MTIWSCCVHHCQSYYPSRLCACNLPITFSTPVIGFLRNCICCPYKLWRCACEFGFLIPTDTGHGSTAPTPSLTRFIWIFAACFLMTEDMLVDFQLPYVCTSFDWHFQEQIVYRIKRWTTNPGIARLILCFSSLSNETLNQGPISKWPSCWWGVKPSSITHSLDWHFSNFWTFDLKKLRLVYWLNILMWGRLCCMLCALLKRLIPSYAPTRKKACSFSVTSYSRWLFA